MSRFPHMAGLSLLAGGLVLLTCFSAAGRSLPAGVSPVSDELAQTISGSQYNCGRNPLVGTNTTYCPTSRVDLCTSWSVPAGGCGTGLCAYDCTTVNFIYAAGSQAYGSKTIPCPTIPVDTCVPGSISGCKCSTLGATITCPNTQDIMVSCANAD